MYALEDFVRVVPVFTHNDHRTIERLTLVYEDLPLLKSYLSSLLSGILGDAEIYGKRILLKPNWVKHSFSESDEICMRTHNRFLEAVLEVLLRHSPAKIVIGDAPVQGCIWDGVVSADLVDTIGKLSVKFSTPIEIRDFRRKVFRPSSNQPISDLHPQSDYRIFDLGPNSYLESITSVTRNVFRVTDYNPDLLAESHKPGVHKYCITNELFASDLIISLPKVKTHQKAGITAALKNIVGINGDKDFLPHHRLGGTEIGGDCYPGRNWLRYLSEISMDNANRNQGKAIYRLWQKVSSLLWRLSLPSSVHQFAAGWHGNDTCWRMVLDLNKIVVFGNSDGSISSEPQRKLYSLCDGIIGGQGDGPLKPFPLPLGIIAFANHSVLCDIALATLMGFDSMKIPMLKAAAEFCDLSEFDLYYDGRRASISQLREFSIKTQPPPGWIKHFKE